MQFTEKKVTELVPFETFKIGKQRKFRTLAKIMIPNPKEWSELSYKHMEGYILLILTNCSQIKVPIDTIVTVEFKEKVECSECLKSFHKNEYNYGQTPKGIICSDCINSKYPTVDVNDPNFPF